MTPRKPSKSSPLTEENSDSTGTPRPNSRSSEIVDPMRRSFTGNLFQKPSIVANPRAGFNPVTPANSPSDWGVRGRESNTMRFLRESSEEKENSRDWNNQTGPAAKSPSSKGMKNFMSPTISAALKINASPSKKILTERNSHDQSLLRSSVTSWGDVRSSFSSISNLSETPEESETRFDKELDLKGSVLNPTVATADSLPDPSALEAIDANPLSPMPLPPYDPKTNFLALRPKFLYYKPKKEMDCNPLYGDDGLFSDSFSESEATEETESDCSQNESVDVVSSQVVVSKEEDEEKEDAAAHTGIEKESVVMEKERSRQHLFTGSKCILSAFILILIACSTMIETDHHLQKARSYNPMIKESSFPVALEVVSRKTEYWRRLVGENLRLWCDFSVSYFGGLMSELRGEYQLGHVIFFNLTNLEEKKMKKSLVKEGDSEICMMIPEQNVQIEAEESEPDSRIEAEVEVDVVEEGSEYDEISSSVEFEFDDDNANSSCTTDEEEEVKSVEGEEEEAETVQSSIEEVIAVVEENIILEEPELVTIQSGEAEEEQKVICSVEEENILEEESEIVVATEKESEVPQVEELIPTDDIKIVSQHSAEAESIKSSNRMTQIAAALSSLTLSLVAGCVAFKKIRSSSSSSMVNAAQAEQEEEEEEEYILGGAEKKFNISPISGNNNLMAAFDCVGDSSSWPSEISLEEHKGLKNRSGGHLPRKSSSRRRESVAASSSSDMSMGGSVSPSLSYGSFTTYEMIPTKKKRNGDEELVITPLRRSSRLRK